MAQEILMWASLRLVLKIKKYFMGLIFLLIRERLMYLWDLTEQVSLLLVMLSWVTQDMRY